MLEIIVWMKRLTTLAAFASMAVVVGLLAAQVLGAPPSTSIAPITVERAGLERTAPKKQQTKDSREAKQQNESDETSDGASVTVYPRPLPAGDDDDEDDGGDDEDRRDDDGPDTDDGVDDDGASN